MGLGINNTNFPIGTFLYHEFSARKGNRVRAAIAWNSNADCPSIENCSYDRLDTDLDLKIEYWNGTSWESVPGALSANSTYSYELVDFRATNGGLYRIGVYKYRSDEETNSLGIALVQQSDVFLPVVMKRRYY